MLILIPFWVNEIVRTFAWLLILTEQGVLNQALLALGLILPHALPGAIAGGIMVLMFSVGTYVVPDILGGKGAIWFVQII